MQYDKMLDKILALPFDTMTEVYANDTQKVLYSVRVHYLKCYTKVVTGVANKI